MIVRRPGGFTLVEVLIALALSAMLAVGVARLLAGGRGAARATSARSDATLSLELGADLLTREVRRAGYVPYPPQTGVTLDSSGALELWLRPQRPTGDRLAIRYVDDRLSGGPIARDLSFEADVDGRGIHQLYRASAAGSRQPLVEGVGALIVSGWVDAGGLHARSALTPGTLDPWLLLLRLRAPGAAAARTVAIPLPSRPHALVRVLP